MLRSGTEIKKCDNDSEDIPGDDSLIAGAFDL
jgi:hypothetical protein